MAAKLKSRMKIDNLASAINWKKGPSMTVAMYGNVHAVEIDNIIFVGGGSTDIDEDQYHVMAYDTALDYWRSTEPFCTKFFTMVANNKKLVLIGGMKKNGYESSEVGQWESYDNSWRRPFPFMQTARISPSATSFRGFIVVAGGFNSGCTQSVEVLDIRNMQWSLKPAFLPTPWTGMKSAVIDRTWYFMGGKCEDMNYSPDAYSVSLGPFVAQVSPGASLSIEAITGEPIAWAKLPPHNTTNSCPVNIGGNLVAVGGKKTDDPKPLSSIQHYVPSSKDNKWSQVAQLPHEVYNCACIHVLDTIYVMGGSRDSQTRYDTLFYSVVN